MRSPVRRFTALAGMMGACLSLLGCGSEEETVTLTSVLPAEVSARGGQSITLRGSGFGKGTTVQLGDEPMKDVDVVSAQEIHVTLPPLFAGSVPVSVETAAGKTAALSGGLSVLALDLAFREAPPHAFSTDPAAPVAAAALGDFDGDGDPDLVTCAAAVPCRLLRNDGRGNFIDSPESKSGPRFPDGMPDTRALAAADFDGDGALDLFLGVGAEGPGVVYRNDGAASFSDALTLNTDADPVTVAIAGDVDGDGKPDLLIANDTADSIPLRVHLNRSTRSKIAFELAEDGMIPERDWIVSAMTLADVDGDGAPDLLLSTPGAADGIGARLLLGGKTGFHEALNRLPSAVMGDVRAFAVGDVNGDGAPDIIAVGSGRDRLFLNDGSGHFFDATAGALPLDASPGTSVALVDLDRDRDLDLVIGNAGAETRLYLNDGTGRFFDHTPLLPIRSDATVWVGAADVDGDADEDILILNGGAGPSRLYLSVEPSDVD